MPERSIGAVSKTVVRATAPGVRIPLSPQPAKEPAIGWFFAGGSGETCFGKTRKQKKTKAAGTPLFCGLPLLPSRMAEAPKACRQSPSLRNPQKNQPSAGFLLEGRAKLVSVRPESKKKRRRPGRLSFAGCRSSPPGWPKRRRRAGNPPLSATRKRTSHRLVFLLEGRAKLVSVRPESKKKTKAAGTPLFCGLPLLPSRMAEAPKALRQSLFDRFSARR
jgi:hypothetical protein